MKRFYIVVVLAAIAGLQLLPAQSLVDNSYYKRSLELHALATQSFEEGDYDGAADYAAQSSEYASLSDKFVEKMLSMSAADKSIAAAKNAKARADADNAAIGWPTEYQAAADALGSALSAYKDEDFGTAKAKADESMDSFGKLRETMAAAYQAKLVAKAKADAELAAAKSAADQAIAAAKARIAWAASVNADKNWPAPWGVAQKEIATALTAYGQENYPSAQSHAEAVLAALASLTGSLPFPAVYVVRLIPGRSDCLWRIAEYTFIYNNPLKWPVIYEANKKTFKDPSNPNLIFPGQKLQIPNISGETRSGTFDPAKVYDVFPNPKKK